MAWEPVDVTPILKDGRTTIPEYAIESIRRNKVALKGPLAVSQATAVLRDWDCARLTMAYRLLSARATSP